MRIQKYLRLVVFPHTVFALPFALIGMLTAAGGMPSWRVLALVLVCMVCARSSAMAFNRIVDCPFDAINPRTARRPLPAGELDVRGVAFFVMINSVLFIAATALLSRLALLLSPAALALIFFYSFTKRFTWLSHLVLGACLAIAPIGAWIAVTGTIGLPALVLSGAVALWVSGFDILYSLQDMEFDREHGLYSVPARFGLAGSLRISRALHAGCIVLLGVFGLAAGLTAVYYAGLAAMALLLSRQHFLVRKGDLSRMGTAFFTVNGWVSMGMLAAVALDLFLR